MIECSAIIKLIDEADRPDALPVEADNHITSCLGCRAFADKRAGLRKLVATSARVQAPANFDALLRERLEATRSARTFSWFSPAMLARTGTAAAAVVVVIFAAKFTLLSGGDVMPPANKTQSEERMAPVSPGNTAPAPHSPDKSSVAEIATPTAPIANPGKRRPKPGNDKGSNRYEGFEPADFTGIDPRYIILRGDKGDTKVPIPSVSAGAQPQLHSESRRKQPEVVKISM